MLGALKQIWVNPYVRVAIGLLLVVLLYLLLIETRSVWSSFLIAYLVAYLINPLVSWFERRDFHRSFGVFVVVLLLLVSLGLLWLLGIQLAAQLTVFTGELPDLISTVEELPFLISRQIGPNFWRALSAGFRDAAAARAGRWRRRCCRLWRARARGAGCSSGSRRSAGAAFRRLSFSCSRFTCFTTTRTTAARSCALFHTATGPASRRS